MTRGAQEIAKSIRELTATHQPRTARISAPTPGDWLGQACITCDELWPCDVGVLIVAFTTLTESVVTLESRIRAIAESDELAQTAWQRWYSEMYRQERPVSGEKSSWKWLPQRDRMIDQAIAIGVVEKLLEILAQE